MDGIVFIANVAELLELATDAYVVEFLGASSNANATVVPSFISLVASPAISTTVAVLASYRTAIYGLAIPLGYARKLGISPTALYCSATSPNS